MRRGGLSPPLFVSHSPTLAEHEARALLAPCGIPSPAEGQAQWEGSQPQADAGSWERPRQQAAELDRGWSMAAKRHRAVKWAI